MEYEVYLTEEEIRSIGEALRSEMNELYEISEKYNDDILKNYISNLKTASEKLGKMQTWIIETKGKR